MNFKKLGVVFLLLICLVSLTFAQNSSSTGVEKITADNLKNYLHFVAADEIEGRDTPSRGLNITAKFIAAFLTSWGVKPAGDNGTYFQKFNLLRDRVDSKNTEISLNNQSFKYGEDYLTLPIAGNGEGKLIFGGYGWYVKSKNIDAYRGMDVKGKIVVVVNAPNAVPPNVTADDLAGEKGIDWNDGPSYALQKGAIAVIVVGSNQTQADFSKLRDLIEATDVVPENSDNRKSHGIATILGNKSFFETLFKDEKFSLERITNALKDFQDLPSFEFTENKRVKFSNRVVKEVIPTQNVVGIIEGGHSKLKNEYLALGCHYDHIGTLKSLNEGDKIYNGADDNGSGTVAMMAMAEALSRSKRRPKRSILFVWHAGEEHGLWGSRYFVENPTVPINQIIAQLNMDMIGRSRQPGDNNPTNQNLSGENEIFVIGSKMMSSKLAEITESTNKKYLKLSYNYKFDDPNDPERLFYRSDHYNYAKKGIPIVFWFDGLHADYHRVSDEVEKIDFTKLEKVTRTVYLTAWNLADLKERIRVDKPLNK